MTPFHPFPSPCRLVILLQQYITLTLYQQQAITRGVEEATRALGFINRANDARDGFHTCAWGMFTIIMCGLEEAARALGFIHWADDVRYGFPHLK